MDISKKWTLATLTTARIGEKWADGADEKPEDGVLYSFSECTEDGSEVVYGRILWTEDGGRAGVMLNSDPIWTDATSPEDALMRHLSGTMTDA